MKETRSDDYPDDCDGEDWDGEDDDFDCGLQADGTCIYAGTEMCDWECPHSDELETFAAQLTARADADRSGGK